MKRGFQLLHTRSLNNPVGEYDIKLPEKYSLFIKTYDVGDNSLLEESYLNTVFNQKRFALSCHYEPMKQIYFDGFNTIQEAIKIKEDIEEYENSKFLPIGYCINNASILVSLEGDDKEVIYFDDFELSYYDDDPNNPEGLVRLSDNIFEFVQGLELKISEDIDPSNFYKNWCEDFWRIHD